MSIGLLFKYIENYQYQEFVHQFEKNPSGIDVLNSEGKSLLYIAIEHECPQIIDFLLDRGAKAEKRNRIYNPLKLANQLGKKEAAQNIELYCQKYSAFKLEETTTDVFADADDDFGRLSKLLQPSKTNAGKEVAVKSRSQKKDDISSIPLAPQPEEFLDPTGKQLKGFDTVYDPNVSSVFKENKSSKVNWKTGVAFILLGIALTTGLVFAGIFNPLTLAFAAVAAKALATVLSYVFTATLATTIAKVSTIVAFGATISTALTALTKLSEVFFAKKLQQTPKSSHYIHTIGDDGFVHTEKIDQLSQEIAESKMKSLQGLGDLERVGFDLDGVNYNRKSREEIKRAIHLLIKASGSPLDKNETLLHDFMCEHAQRLNLFVENSLAADLRRLNSKDILTDQKLDFGLIERSFNWIKDSNGKIILDISNKIYTLFPTDDSTDTFVLDDDSKRLLRRELKDNQEIYDTHKKGQLSCLLECKIKLELVIENNIVVPRVRSYVLQIEAGDLVVKNTETLKETNSTKQYVLPENSFADVQAHIGYEQKIKVGDGNAYTQPVALQYINHKNAGYIDLPQSNNSITKERSDILADELAYRHWMDSQIEQNAYLQNIAAIQYVDMDYEAALNTI